MRFVGTWVKATVAMHVLVGHGWIVSVVRGFGVAWGIRGNKA